MVKEGSSSVSFVESGTYTWGAWVRMTAAWLFFALLSVAYSIVPILSLVAIPALVGCVGLITQSYAYADRTRLEPTERKRRASRRPPVGHGHVHAH
jgi:hypothetical protein